MCGGVITGLTIARELLRKGYENVVILEKGKRLGGHASGRNSGGLHAGIYYTPDSLNARFCLRVNSLIKLLQIIIIRDKIWFIPSVLWTFEYVRNILNADRLRRYSLIKKRRAPCQYFLCLASIHQRP
ncbi:MAG: FAD-dependent oxidoreductase [Thermodesulfovibrionia bacterium]